MIQNKDSKLNLSIDSPCFDCMHNDSCMLGDVIGEEHAKSVEHMEMHYAKGETLIKQGTIAPHVLFVKKGMVKIFLEHKDRRQVLCIERGGFVGLESMYNDKYFQYSVSAVSDVTVCLLEIDGLKRAISVNASFAAKLLKSVNIRSKNLYSRIITLTQKQAHARVADILLCMVERLFSSAQFELPFTRKELAEMATLSVESLSRILKEFKMEGIVESDGKQFEILDYDKLKQISNFG
ncbi:MAG: Crp/Fnr family transcriptional regulator [Bacteroidota bacterium]